MTRTPGFGAIVEALLKQPGALLFELNGERRTSIISKLFILVVICTVIYGFVMGSLSGGIQIWAAPVKLTVGMLFSMLICLPSLYIFLCLSGADLRIGQVCGALLAMGSLLSLLLIGFAPVAWIFSQSTNSVTLMGALHLVFWIIGLWFGTRFILGLMQFGQSSDRTHIKVWILIFVFVSLQMTAVLRPLVGTEPELIQPGKKFFPMHWIECIQAEN